MKKIWFKRKKYGWGWTPVTWQGFVVILLAILVFLFFWLDLMKGNNIFENIAVVVLDFAILLYICFKKGESPRWQWGEKKEE